MSTSPQEELLEVNQRLLDAIVAGDWDTYAELCDPTLTCFEPEARGHVVAGLEFHQFYFEGGASEARRNVTMSAPVVHLAGDVGIVAYVRLSQSEPPGGAPTTSACEETRVWRKTDGAWRHIHFHRSAIA